MDVKKFEVPAKLSPAPAGLLQLASALRQAELMEARDFGWDFSFVLKNQPWRLKDETHKPQHWCSTIGCAIGWAAVLWNEQVEPKELSPEEAPCIADAERYRNLLAALKVPQNSHMGEVLSDMFSMGPKVWRIYDKTHSAITADDVADRLEKFVENGMEAPEDWYHPSWEIRKLATLP